MRAPKAAPRLYESDFALWLEQQARALRERRFADLDLPSLIEEIDGLAGRDRRELGGRIRVVLTHLLKVAHQPQRTSRSWETTILTQRADIARLLEQSPSLRRLIPEEMKRAYPQARRIAASETRLSLNNFPECCAFTVEDVLDDA